MIKVICPRCEEEIETEVREDNGRTLLVYHEDCGHTFTVIL